MQNITLLKIKYFNTLSELYGAVHCLGSLEFLKFRRFTWQLILHLVTAIIKAYGKHILKDVGSVHSWCQKLVDKYEENFPNFMQGFEWYPKLGSIEVLFFSKRVDINNVFLI